LEAAPRRATLLHFPANPIQALVIALDRTLDEAKITVAMLRLDEIWDQLFHAEQSRIVKLLVEKLIVSPNDIEVQLRASGIEELSLELGPTVPEEVAA
jgi:hypothetical protein